MAHWVSALRVERLQDGTWRLLDALIYVSEVLQATLEVPARYTTDFASVPRWVPLAYATMGNRGHPAAVVHDYLYQTHLVARRQADAVFAEALRVTGEAPWRCWIMWAAVRVFGAPAYDSGPSRYVMLRNATLRHPQLTARPQEAP